MTKILARCYIVCVLLAFALMLTPLCWRDGYYADIGNGWEIIDLGLRSYFDPGGIYFARLTAYGSIPLVLLSLSFGAKPGIGAKSCALTALSVLITALAVVTVATDTDNVTVLGYIIAALLACASVCRVWLLCRKQ